MITWKNELIEAKYHFSVAERLYDGYKQYPEKRFLTGMINEMAKATSSIIRAYLIKMKKRRMKDFKEIIAKQYLEKRTQENLLKTLEIQKAQKISPVQFIKENKIILLIKGKYRIITVERLEEFKNSIKETIKKFPQEIRQV